MQKTIFFNIFETQKGRQKILLTKNLCPGKTVYMEKLIKEGRDEYREWIPQKSKLAAAIMKGISQIGIREGNAVLYLGAASGTTASHVSDIITNSGFIFAVEFSPRVLRDLIFVCEDRNNIAPILGDANLPQKYFHKVLMADIVYQDIAQRNQTEIFLKNCKLFLKNGGFGLLAVKARSIDVTKRPREIFKQVRSELEKELTIVDYRELEPFERDHAMFVVKKK